MSSIDVKTQHGSKPKPGELVTVRVSFGNEVTELIGPGAMVIVEQKVDEKQIGWAVHDVAREEAMVSMMRAFWTWASNTRNVPSALIALGTDGIAQESAGDFIQFMAGQGREAWKEAPGELRNLQHFLTSIQAVLRATEPR